MKIYVASSWRNEKQPEVVQRLREEGFEVYDFRNPAPGNTGFSWAQIDPKWQEWTPAQFREALEHPLAVAGFKCDLKAMEWADVVVMVMPCGRSAHLETGWGTRARRTAVLLTDGEPELMYRLIDCIATDISEIVEWLKTDDARCSRCRDPFTDCCCMGGPRKPAVEW